MPLDHYVSQVHLRNFYSPILGQRMYALRKSDLKSFTPNSESVCRIMDGSTNSHLQQDRVIEEFLKSVEPKYNAAVAKLRRGEIDHEVIYTIAGFVAYVTTCSPTGLRLFCEPLERLAETLLVETDKRGLLPLPPEELAGKHVADLLHDGDLKIAVDPKYSQALGISTILRHVAAFGNFNWDVLLNKFDDSPFFSSDFPQGIERSPDWRVFNRVVPLAPDLAIRIRPDLTGYRKRADFSFSRFGCRVRNAERSEISKINRLLVWCAEDVVFYSNDLPWIQKFVARNRFYRVEQVTEKVPASGGSLLITTHRIVDARVR